MNNPHIITEYIEALTARAEMAGDGRLEFAMGYLWSTLQALKLQTYELEILERDTYHLNKTINNQ